MSGQIMMFPDSVEEFMESYKMVDTEHIYSNGAEYVPIFRMKQWFEHEVKHGKWIKNEIVIMGEGYVWNCSYCGKSRFYGFNEPTYNYCPNCGAKMDATIAVMENS